MTCINGSIGGNAKARRLGYLDPDKTAVFVCDIQEKFAPSILHFDTIVSNSERILKTAQLLNIPCISTEQYPKGLGSTVEPLKSLISSSVAKTKFTMIVPEVEEKLDQLKNSRSGMDTIVLCGIETHVCIVATCIDLIHRGFNVHVVADAVSSRTQTDRQFALERMRNIGAHINTTESVVLSLVGDASHPKFKEVQRIIKEINADTELLAATKSAL